MENHRIFSTLPSLMKSRFSPTLPYGIAAFDAGAANLIFSLVKKLPSMPVWLDLDGPAKALWSQYFPDMVTPNQPLTKDLSSVITGTGWGSDLEHRARLRARELGVPTIGVLDHWTNYEQRFSRQGNTCLSDEIWVFDPHAESIAQETFPGIPIFLRNNDYIEQEASEIKPLGGVKSSDILYLLEPARSYWNRAIPGEFQALDYFLGKINKLKPLIIDNIWIRPHPSEQTNKYDNYLNRKAGPSIQLTTKSLTEEISRVKYVVGCQTFAMVIALRAGRTVYSSLPPWAPPCALPHPEIVHLKNI
jgi:hypothetical protein